MEKSQNIKVNIIVPIFNVENYLKDCLDSIKNQTYSNFECILINDGSTDKSEEIAREFLKNDKRFLLLNKPNAGLSSARNAGLEISLGTALRDILENNYKEEFIVSNKEINTFNKEIKNIAKSEILNHFTKDEQERVYNCDLGDLNTLLVQDLSENLLIRFVDSDDILPQDSIQNCIVAGLNDNENIDKFEVVVHTYLLNNLITKEQKIHNSKGSKYYFQSKNNMKSLTKQNLYDYCFGCHGMFRAGILNRYNLRFLVSIQAEDLLFGIILFNISKYINKVDGICYIYNQDRNGSITSKRKEKWPLKTRNELEVLRKYFDNFKEASDYHCFYSFVKILQNINNFKDEILLNKDNLLAKMLIESTWENDIEILQKNFNKLKNILLMHLFYEMHLRIGDIDPYNIKENLYKLGIDYNKELKKAIIRKLLRKPKKIFAFLRGENIF